MRAFGSIVRSVAIVALLASVGCKSESPHYVFVLPDGYVGSIQVIFNSPESPELVPNRGRFFLRVDKSGVVKTSSPAVVFAGSHDEFFYSRFDLKGKEVLAAVPANFYCAQDSGMDWCYGGEGTVSDGFTVGRASLGRSDDGTAGNSWFLFVGPPQLRAKMAKPIHRAPGQKYQIDVPEDDPQPGMVSAKP